MRTATILTRALATGCAVCLLLVAAVLFVPRLRDVRMTAGAVLARFGWLVGVEYEEITFPSAGATLSGTIVFPNRPQPMTSIVIVHGSGRASRMLWLARLFASEGFATLTYDKRGVNRSGGEFVGGLAAGSLANLDLLAEDAARAAAVLYEHPRTRTARIGYVGLSQAGWIAPMAAAKPPAVSFLVLFSGVAVTLSEEAHFSDLAEGDPDFWNTHSHDDVAEIMKSAPVRSGDVDARMSLRALRIPGFWAFGDRDNVMPVDLSVARLEELKAEGQTYFEHRTYPGYGHDLIFLDVSTFRLSAPFRDAVSWMTTAGSRVP